MLGSPRDRGGAGGRGGRDKCLSLEPSVVRADHVQLFDGGRRSQNGPPRIKLEAGRACGIKILPDLSTVKTGAQVSLKVTLKLNPSKFLMEREGQRDPLKIP